MINYSHPILIALREIGQRFGMLRPTVRLLRRLLRSNYEDHFDRQMMALILPGDIVWDVGANVGFFTAKFAEKVGAVGKVYAFEPGTSAYQSLVALCGSSKNVICKKVALSNRSGEFRFRESGIENDPTNGLIEDDVPGSVIVNVHVGDELVSKYGVAVPNAIKVDVEGYELDVFQGMSQILERSELKKIFVEVHFLEIKKRGIVNGAHVLVSLVERAGFVVKWTDPSHFIALRNT